MTSILLKLTGAKAQATVDGPLTAGMVGIPVTIEYDEAWNGLTKHLVCRCGEWGHDRGETRTVRNIENAATVAHEVMLAGQCLYLGVEGYSADGKLVLPSTWADCGKIQHGANVGADPSADPALPVWAQLQGEIRKLRQNAWTEKQITDIIASYLEENPVEIPDLPQSGLTAEQIDALDKMFRVCAFTKDDVSAEHTAFKVAFGITDSGENGGDDSGDEEEPEVTLTGISATYSGGDAPAGITPSGLVGVVVTAHYSDGTSKTVTDYTLSGTIAMGENIITVTYQGMSATFTVIGVDSQSSGGFETDIPSQNLMGYYDMRTVLTADNHIKDLSGNGRDLLFYPANGYYENGTLYRGDKASNWISQSADYSITDGANGMYSYGENVTFFVTISGHTSGTTPLMNTGVNNMQHKQMITFQGGVILYHQAAGFNNVASDTQLTPDALVTICAVMSATEEKIYLNGVLKNTSAAKGGTFGAYMNLLMGYYSDADADTKIHNAAVYDAALGDEEVAAISATLFANAGGEA